MDFGIQGFNPPFVPTLFMQIQKLMTLKLFLKICSFCPSAQEVIYLPWISETRKKYSLKYQVSGGRSLCQLQIPPIYKDQTTFTIHLYTHLQFTRIRPHDCGAGGAVQDTWLVGEKSEWAYSEYNAKIALESLANDYFCCCVFVFVCVHICIFNIS